MAVAAIKTDEDRSNPDIGWNTFKARTIDLGKTVDWMSSAADVESAQTGYWQARLELTELTQKKSIVPSVAIPRISKEHPGKATFFARQEWEGYVVAINGKEFTARLVDLTGRGTYEDEEAQIPLEEVSDADVPKMQVGSIFRWVIGVRRSPMGQKERVSFLVFRDLPAMSKSDVQAGKAWAKKILASFEE